MFDPTLVRDDLTDEPFARDMGTAPLDGLVNLGQSIVCLGQLYAREEVRRIAANIAKLPELLRKE